MTTRESRPVGDWPASEQILSSTTVDCIDGNTSGGQTSTYIEVQPPDDTVIIPRAEYQQLQVAAESWWRFWGGDYLDDLVDQRFVAMSHSISRGVRWSGIGPRHQELARLRVQPAWVSPCRRFGCKRQQTVYTVEEWRAGWRCADHTAAAA